MLTKEYRACEWIIGGRFRVKRGKVFVKHRECVTYGALSVNLESPPWLFYVGVVLAELCCKVQEIMVYSCIGLF